MIKYLLSSLLLTSSLSTKANLLSDSTARSTISITPRLNSAGYFPFTGALLNHHTNVDLNIVYQNKIFGFLAFKSVDFEESQSPVNYLQSALFKQLKIKESLSITIYAGYLFSQTQAFRDEKDSDYFGAFGTYWDVNKNLRIENIALLNDVSVQFKIVNRLSILYTFQKFRFDFSLHERYVPETKNSTTSTAFAINLPRIMLARHLSALSTITYQTYITPERPAYALKNGFLFSLSFPMNFP